MMEEFYYLQFKHKSDLQANHNAYKSLTVLCRENLLVANMDTNTFDKYYRRIKVGFLWVNSVVTTTELRGETSKFVPYASEEIARFEETWRVELDAAIQVLQEARHLLD